jgi:hypothetical protein
MASYSNYPGGNALKALHEVGELYLKKLKYDPIPILFYMQKLQNIVPLNQKQQMTN